jgi:hypothetical protein
MSENGTPDEFRLFLSVKDPSKDETYTWKVSQAPKHGAASLSSGGSYTKVNYNPQADFTGQDAFTVQVSGSSSGTAETKVIVTVTASLEAEQYFLNRDGKNQAEQSHLPDGITATESADSFRPSESKRHPGKIYPSRRTRTNQSNPATASRRRIFDQSNP